MASPTPHVFEPCKLASKQSLRNPSCEHCVCKCPPPPLCFKPCKLALKWEGPPPPGCFKLCKLAPEASECFGILSCEHSVCKWGWAAPPTRCSYSYFHSTAMPATRFRAFQTQRPGAKAVLKACWATDSYTRSGSKQHIYRLGMYAASSPPSSAKCSHGSCRLGRCSLGVVALNPNH